MCDSKACDLFLREEHFVFVLAESYAFSQGDESLGDDEDIGRALDASENLGLGRGVNSDSYSKIRLQNALAS